VNDLFTIAAVFLVVSHDVLVTVVSDESVLTGAGNEYGVVVARV